MRISIWKKRAMSASILAMTGCMLHCQPTEAQTFDRVRGGASLKLGYDPAARPFSFKSDQGTPEGYAVALCKKIAEDLKTELNLSQMDVSWVALDAGAQDHAIQDSTVDMICAAAPITLTRRKDVSFSIPIFPGGTGAVLNVSAAAPLREVLEYGEPTTRPLWRGSPARTLLENKTFSSIAGSASEQWLTDKIKTFQLSATLAPVGSYQEGIQRVADGSSAVFFGNMPLLLDAAAHSKDPESLIVLHRFFTNEPLGLELPRSDEDLRLSVDRSLSDTYRMKDFPSFFTAWFGPADDRLAAFFQQTALPN